MENYCNKNCHDYVSEQKFYECLKSQMRQQNCGMPMPGKPPTVIVLITIFAVIIVIICFTVIAFHACTKARVNTRGRSFSHTEASLGQGHFDVGGIPDFEWSTVGVSSNFHLSAPTVQNTILFPSQPSQGTVVDVAVQIERFSINPPSYEFYARENGANGTEDPPSYDEAVRCE